MKTLIIKYVYFEFVDEYEIKNTKKSFIKTVEEFLHMEGKGACRFVQELSNFKFNNQMVFEVSPLMNVDDFLCYIITLDDKATMEFSMYCGAWILIDPISHTQVELPIHFADDLY